MPRSHRIIASLILATLLANALIARIAMAQDEPNYPSFQALGLELYLIHTRIQVSREQMLLVLPQHIEFIKSLEQDGRLFAAGPVADPGNDALRGNGLIIVRAHSFEQANEIALQDPMHSSGARSFSIQRWTLNEGNMQFQVRLSTRQADFE